MSVVELYNGTIKSLSAAERLQLAKLILEDIPTEAVLDYSEEWSEEDLKDFSRESWSRAGQALGESADAEVG